MIWTELFVFTAVVLTGVVGYYLGHTRGSALGFLEGYLYRDRAASGSAGSGGHVRVVEAVYDHEKAGL